MDLRLSCATPTAAERNAVDSALAGVLGPAAGEGHFADAGHDARGRRHLLLPTLHAVSDAVGWISEGALNHIALRLSVPPAEVYGVATFYAMFATETRPPRVVHVCDDVVCGPSGGEALAISLTAGLDPEHVCWVRSPCLGLCERAPAVLHQLAGEPDFSQAPATLADVLTAARGATAAATADQAFADARVSAPQAGSTGLRLLRRVGAVDPDSLDDYRAHGGYSALRRAIELGPSRVIAEICDSGLTGRGGAAFPTGLKWEGVATAPQRPHYLICNADESEPGTFKDRVLMEFDPFGLIEAMTIAGYVTGCEVGYLYIRGEYPLATRRLQAAIEAARRRGYLGPEVMAAGFAFDIQLRRGAGAYICGEETALLNSLEGYRGEPRNKPPFPSVSGLFGKPTLINNVETLYNVLEVLALGGPGFAGTGGGRSTGTKLFCLSGAITVPGVYEVPFGTTLRELLALAGGVTGELRTILLGGAAGGFVLPHQLDTPLTLEGTRGIGATLGSGVILVLDTAADLAALLRRIAAFFRDESCGQCVPCRVGTVRQEEALARLTRGAPLGSRETELVLLSDLARVMQDASICGLGHTAPAAVQSAIALGLLAVPPQSAPGPVPKRLEGTPMSTPVLLGAIRRLVTMTLDGREIRVPESSTILEALHALGDADQADAPTLCWAPNLNPINACRVCVVELEGSRALVPSCARKVEDGMQVRTNTDRVRHSRRMVLELLASSVDLSQASPDVHRWIAAYGVDPQRYGPPAPPAAAGERDRRHAGHHQHPDGSTAETVGQPVKIDNDLYVRDYSRCIMCYKCVKACGIDAQFTFAISAAGRAFDARIATEYNAELPQSACVYCGNCIGVCPTGALKSLREHELRETGHWDSDAEDVTTTVCSFCGVGCNLELHVQHGQIVNVSSPSDHSVTHGHLCIKGRFGFQHVQNLPSDGLSEMR